MSQNFNEIKIKTLGDITDSILELNGGNSGKICFDSPFGKICVNVNTDGYRAKALNLKSSDGKLILGNIIEKLVSNYSVLKRAAVSPIPFSYQASIVLPVEPKNQFKVLGIIDIGVDIDFNF